MNQLNAQRRSTLSIAPFAVPGYLTFIFIHRIILFIRFVKHTHVHLWFLNWKYWMHYLNRIPVHAYIVKPLLIAFSKPLKWNYKDDNFIIIFWIYDCILFHSKRVNKKKWANVKENGIFPFILSAATHHPRSPAWLWIEWNNCFFFFFFFVRDLGTPEVAHKQPEIKLSINFGFCPRRMHFQKF